MHFMNKLQANLSFIGRRDKHTSLLNCSVIELVFLLYTEDFSASTYEYIDLGIWKGSFFSFGRINMHKYRLSQNIVISKGLESVPG